MEAIDKNPAEESTTRDEELGERRAEEPAKKVTPTPVTPEVIEEFADEERADSIELPDHDLFKSGNVESNTFDIEVKSDPNYNFHYKFENDQLYLYGDFSAEPYEILEIKDLEDGGIFLFYMDKYYLLNRQQSAISPLTEITGEENLAKLKQMKNG